jgi:hypothetical protein
MAGECQRRVSWRSAIGHATSEAMIGNGPRRGRCGSAPAGTSRLRFTCQPDRMTKTMITTTSMRLRTTWATMAGRTLRVRSVM